MPPSPAGIAVNNKVVIAVADLDGHCIQVFDETEKFVRKLGSPGHMDSLTNQSTSHSSTMTRFWWQMNVITEYSS